MCKLIGLILDINASCTGSMPQEKQCSSAQQFNSFLMDMQKAADEAAEAAAAAAPEEAVKPPKDKDKAIKELIKSIPRERKDVFAYSLKWDAFDANADAILPKLSKWVRTCLASHFSACCAQHPACPNHPALATSVVQADGLICANSAMHFPPGGHV